MAIKHDLRHSIRNILTRNRDGSYNTQSDRQGLLRHFGDTLIALGYGLRDIKGLKEKHIRAVVTHWQEKGLANATLKNRLSAIRYLTAKINKPNIVPSNQELAIGRRKYAPQFNRALNNPDFSAIKNSHIYISLQLQRVFGLRREEAIKIKPHVADKSDNLALLPTWCKGGRGRSIPIQTQEQQHWLEAAKQLVSASESLIPKGKNYIQHRYIYDKEIQKAGLRNLHGLRHAYAQSQYEKLTGWKAPINGGPSSKELTASMKKIDHDARMIISELIGHSREQVTVNYLGR